MCFEKLSFFKLLIVSVLCVCVACAEPSKTEASDRVRIVEVDGQLQVYLGEKPVLNYHLRTVEAPDSLPQYYRRSGFIHPLYSPSGQVLTDGMPVGHAHQHGIFHAWVNTQYLGVRTDFWNQQRETGTVRHKALKSIVHEPAYASFETELEHLSIREADTTVVLSETWLVKIFNQDKPFRIEFKIAQRNVSKDTLFINEYHYGGFAFRGSVQWNEEDAQHADSMHVLTSKGLDRRAANHSRPEWVAAWGKVNNTFTGVAVRSQASNFRHPQAVRIHPVMPYFCFTPTVAGAFALPPNGRYAAGYELISYDGVADPALIEAQFSKSAATH